VLSSLYLRAYADLNTTYAEVVLKLQAAQSQGTKESSEADALSKQQKALAYQMSELQARAKGLRSAKRMNNVLTFIQPKMGVTSAVWDTDPWLLAVLNGVIDLRTGECRDGVPDDYIRTVAPTEWTGLDTPCPRFERFLQEVFEDKPDRDSIIDFLQRLLGYGITGITTTHIFPILYGPGGRNGKDTLLSILKAILGALVGAVSNDVFLVREGKRTAGAATPHLVDLQGKRLAWGSEPKEEDRLDVAQIKQLTGEGDVPVRQILGHQYSFAPTHKLLLMTNYRPHASADDEAFWPRACLIEFGIRFLTDPNPEAPNERKADLTLKKALLQEQSGILAWLVRGCLAWQRRGLDIPDSIKVATNQYRQEEDQLLLFLQERCVMKSEAIVQGGPFYEAYRKWIEENQLGRGISSINFGKKMKKRFEWGSSNGRVTYRGVGLLAREADPQPQSLFEDQLQPKQASRGSVEGSKSTIYTPHTASEALSEDQSRGCRGLDPIGGNNQKRGLRSTDRVLPSTPSTFAPVTIDKSASEANREKGEDQALPSTDPLLVEETHRCNTIYEKRGKQAHKAVATHKDTVGYWWCDRCIPQQKWMDYGRHADFPSLTFSDLGLEVPAGQYQWFIVAQDTGYELLERALEALEQQR
jgi:putative DNA primase/helicase